MGYWPMILFSLEVSINTRENIDIKKKHFDIGQGSVWWNIEYTCLHQRIQAKCFTSKNGPTQNMFKSFSIAGKRSIC